jgi:hypothetical protein
MTDLVLSVRAHKDDKEITLAMLQDRMIVKEARLDEARTETLIRSLAERRTGLFPARSPDPGDDVLQIAHNPHWQTCLAPDGAHVILDLRHPGMGWLRFQFPLAKAAKLAAGLTDPAC